MCLLRSQFTTWNPKYSGLVSPFIQKLCKCEAPVDGRTTMSIESMCQVARSVLEVGSFNKRLFGVVHVTCGDFHDGSEKRSASVLKFCSNLGENATETLTMIQQAFRDQILSRTQVFQWHSRFKTGRKSVDDYEHTGRPTSSATPQNLD
jgi:hypothetical protein